MIRRRKILVNGFCNTSHAEIERGGQEEGQKTKACGLEPGKIQSREVVVWRSKRSEAARQRNEL